MTVVLTHLFKLLSFFSLIRSKSGHCALSYTALGGVSVCLSTNPFVRRTLVTCQNEWLFEFDYSTLIREQESA